MKALRFVAHRLKKEVEENQVINFALAMILMPFIIVVLLWRQLKWDWKCLKEEYQEFN